MHVQDRPASTPTDETPEVEIIGSKQTPTIVCIVFRMSEYVTVYLSIVANALHSVNSLEYC